MKEKRKTPYQMLLKEVKEWASKVRYRHEKEMWLYPKKYLTNGWSMAELYERVSAAEQLGYDVVLYATKDGLSVRYRKQIPNVPLKWQ